MRSFPLLVSLVAVGFGLASIYSNYAESHTLSNGGIQGLQGAESHGRVAKLQLWPLDEIDIAMFLVIAVCLSLAGGAGIGGGAVLVPVFIMLRGWPTSTAVAMSNVTVLGGSFANFICNVNRHRPTGARTIDWELILMMEPTTIAGALFGAMLNKLLPNYITTYLLTAMLTFMAIRLYQKGRQAYAKETQLLKAARHAAKAAAKQAAAEQLHLLAAEPGLGQQQPLPARSSSLTARSHNRAEQSAAAVVLGNNAIARSLNRSFSRLQSPMIMLSDGAAAGSSPRSTPRSITWQQLTPTGTPSHRTGAAAAAEAAAPEAAAVEAGPGLEGVAAWLPGMLQGDANTHLANLRQVSTLCQGDTLGDTVEAMVALPLDPSFSSSTSSSEAGAAPAAPAGDLEEGFRGAAGSADDDDDDENDLTRPLLAAAAAAAAAAAPAGEGAWGSGEVHGEVPGQLARQATPDLLMHVGDDVVHGQRDVAAEGAPPMLKGAASSDAAADPLAATGCLVIAAKKVRNEPCLPIPHLLALLLLSAWVVASDIFQDSVICGSWEYWAVTLSVLLPITVILLIFRQLLLRKYNHDALAPGSVLPEGQLHWTATTTLLYPAICSSAGLVAGLFGIGGGVVKGPLMLELGVAPDVAAATSATMIMFTAGSACVVYSRFGQILADYGALLVAFGFFTTLGSQLLTFVLIKLLGRRSVIVFMMVTLMSIACTIMYVQSGIVTKRLVQHPEELSHFGGLCPQEPKGVGQLLQQLLLRRVHLSP